MIGHWICLFCENIVLTSQSCHLPLMPMITATVKHCFIHMLEQTGAPTADEAILSTPQVHQS